MLTSQQTYKTGRPRGFVLLLFLASLIFCAAPASAVGAAEPKAELVNQKDEPSGGLSRSTGQVQLIFPDGHTRLLPYRSYLQPSVIGGKVYIFTTKDAVLTGIVIYDSAKGRGQSFPLPKDLKRHRYFGQPSFSPDGSMVAYYFVSEHERKSQPKKIEPELKECFIDRTGKAVANPVPRENKRQPRTGDFSEGLAHSYYGTKMGFKDLAGKIVIPPQFDQAGHFSEGLAPVQVDKKWGFIDKTGKTVLPPQYYDASSFSEGLAAVNVGGKLGYGKWGFIDQEGKMVIPAQYDAVRSFSEGLAGVLIDGKYGFIDKTGKIVIQPRYDAVEDFSQGIATVQIGDQGAFLGGVRVRSWPGWRLLWQSALYPLRATDWPSQPPLWESNSLVEFDPIFFDPPRFLKYQVPEPGGKDAQ